MNLLSEKEDIQFLVDPTFNINYLYPVQKFVEWKLENNCWDDYNELFHACQLVELLKKEESVWFETHLIVKNEVVIGSLIIVGGEIAKLENKYSIEDQEHSLLLKYFHIVEKGKGYGSQWLKSVIFPYYREKGYRQIFVNSSHKDSFPFYARLGNLIATYEQPSDNQIYTRRRNSYLIKI